MNWPNFIVAVNGLWDDWSEWSECSSSCGPGGKMYRERKCRPPANGGQPCEGDDFEMTDCDKGACPG